MSSKSDFTKQQISQTLFNLLQKYPVDAISISQLVDEAGVSRSAFYNNYKDIEEIIKDSYYHGHFECFGDKFKNIDYVFSDDYIFDTINFFDKNTNLLTALCKWNLLSYIAKEKTIYTYNLIKKVMLILLMSILSILRFIQHHVILKCVVIGF